MKKNKTITVHTIVKNEEQWVWYALMSVIGFVDKIFVFDTESTDKTVAIIKTIKSPKIVFEQKGRVDAFGLRKLRQEQLERTTTDWFLIVDGDEVWPKETLKEVKSLINKAPLDIYGIVVPAWNLIGDLNHFHPESVDYQWPYAPKKIKGWFNLRAINRKIPGLYLKGSYPLEAYCDRKNIPLQNYGSKRLLFTKNRYFHMSYLPRSSDQEKRSLTLKKGPKKIPEIGKRLPEEVAFPEAFYLKRPSIVPSCWIKQSVRQKMKAAILTPFKKIKRRIFKYKN